MKPPSTARTAGRSDRAERRFRRQPFILLSFSSSKKARKAQETQSYQRFQHIGHTAFNTSGTNGPRLLSRVKMGTRSALLKESHTTAHTAKQGGISDGGGITTLGPFCVVRKPCVARGQNGVLCRFWVLVGDAPEERREPAEQRCAYARRCSEASRPRWAALLCLQLGDVTVLSLCAQYFLNVRGEGWYHYPRRALRAAETPDGRLSKRLVCRFLRSIGIAPCATPIFLRIYRYPCR